MIAESTKKEIDRRLEVVNKYYDFDALLARKTDHAAVAKYYRKSDFFYNKIHSRGGYNIHMGLSSDGVYHREDLLKLAEYVGEFINKGTKKVLELGAGRVANTKFLAERFPNVEFTAVDLPKRRLKKNKVPANVTLKECNYNDLSGFEPESFDLVFAIETFCYNEDKEHVVAEVEKVLKPGGKLIIFDVYEPKPHSKMSDYEQRISAITLSAMCITPKDQYIGDTEKYLKKHHFSEVEVANLTKEIMPSVNRIARFSNYYFTHPAFLRVVKTILPFEATMNGIAGWLMPLTFDGKNIHEYGRIVATKEK